MAVKHYGPQRLASIKKWTGSNGLSGYWEAAQIPIDGLASTQTVLGRIVTDTLCTGDLLDIQAWATVTNDTGHLPHDPAGASGYTVGVGWNVRAYEYTGPGITNPSFLVESLNGGNVTKNGLMHHMPVMWNGLYEVPEAMNGKRLVLCFQVGAHSTAARAGDWLTVEPGYGRFTVAHMTTGV